MSMTARRISPAALVLIVAFLCAQNAQAFWAMQIYRPYSYENCIAYGGLFAVNGTAESDGAITQISVFTGTNKLGNASISYLEETQQKRCTWAFPWSNIVAQTASLRIVAYSTSLQGAYTTSIDNVTFTPTANQRPEALTSRAHVAVNTTNSLVNTVYFDPDSDQFWTAIPIGTPQHGAVSNRPGSSALYYTPSNGFCGVDSFSYMISDGVTTSAPATCQVMVHAPSNPAGSWVMLMVNSNLLFSAASNAIFRMKSDLETEGYTAQIRIWPASGTTPSNVWQCLRDAYTNTEHFMVGAVLMGDIPKPSARCPSFGTIAINELIYWNMKNLQVSSSKVDQRHIWVSRINVDDTTYGLETTLVVRALDANHAYRRGESRLPFTAYRYRIPSKSNILTNNYLPLAWSVVEQRGDVATNLCFLPSRTDLGKVDGADCMVKGGELFEQVSHGDSSGYMSPDGGTSVAWLTKDLVHRNLVQTRFCILGSCRGGTYGGIGNEHLFTRGGGCVLVTGATEESWQGPISPNSNFVALLAAGYSWGDALVQELGVGNSEYAAFSGDLSLRPMMSGYSNSMPVISGFTASSTNTSAGLAVNFSVAASDPDGTISNIEWFLTGFDGGRTNPAISGTATNVAYVYGTPGTYTARVEAMDNYQARVWKEMTVTVSTAIDRHTLSVGADWGTPVPAVGTYTNDYGTVLTNRVNLYDTRGTTQYVCTGWAMTGNEPAAGSTTNFAMTLTNNAALTWLWKTNYWLATATNGPGTVSVESGWQGLGSNVTVSAAAAPHYHFVNWSSDTNGATITGTNITVTMAGPKSITASFAIDRHTLSVGSDWGTPVPAVGTYPNDYGTTLTNQVNLSDTRGTTQYVCTGWAMTGNEPAAGSTTNFAMTLTNNAALTWLWKTNYWLATATNGPGTVSVESGWQGLGSNVTVSAAAAPHYHFVNWSGDTNGATITGTNITVTMAGPKSITASFAIPYTVTVTKSGNGWSSFGTLSPATRTVAPGSTTQIVFTAADWSRLQSLTTNSEPVPAAVGAKVYTQTFANVSGNISNAVVFEMLTQAQTGYTNVPTAWLANWPENEVVSDPAFDVYTKYLLGLDPTTSNTFSLAIASITTSATNLVIVIQRQYTGGLSPDGMHGRLLLQDTTSLLAPFTNISATAVTGATVFDTSGRKAYTNEMRGSDSFFRVSIQATGD